VKIFLNSIGCRLNQGELEKIANQFLAAGHELTDEPASADLVVVNTCTVTGQAASDSRGALRQAARAGRARVVATGCWATLEPDLAAALPGVIEVIPNTEKDNLVARVLNLPEEDFDLEPLRRQPLPGSHRRTRAFIKVQDGCDNHCTFCITRLARGPARSRPVDSVLKDIHAALEGGTHEVVLTGVQLGSWGKDFEPSLGLYDLIETILAKTPLERLRLSSLEPWNLDDHFFSLWKDERLCAHIHLPLQSGSDSILRRMARKIKTADFERLVDSARQSSPDIAITTDVIVGFPGESEADFQASLDLVKKIDFAGGHVFHFSPRPQTPAALFNDQVAPAVRKERSAHMRALFADLSRRYEERFLGTRSDVLWESAREIGKGGWELGGLTGNYIRASARAGANLWNQVSPVILTGISRQGMVARIESSPDDDRLLIQ
jgi:threonylcarbamoyladenosine tRNA methylthiotransferase MtaB